MKLESKNGQLEIVDDRRLDPDKVLIGLMVTALSFFVLGLVCGIKMF